MKHGELATHQSMYVFIYLAFCLICLCIYLRKKELKAREWIDSCLRESIVGQGGQKKEEREKKDERRGNCLQK